MSLSASPPCFKPGELSEADSEPDFNRRWPPEQFPGLHLSDKEYHALRRRQRRRRELLDLLGPEIADIAAAVMEERTNGQRI
jgi:hypothetical protein